MTDTANHDKAEAAYAAISDTTTDFKVKDLNLDDRPREKALLHGLGVLSDAELMAIVIGSGMRGKSVITMSREILLRYGGSLATLSRQSVNEIAQSTRGMGNVKAITLMAAIELGTRCCRQLELTEYEQIRSAESVFAYMRQRLERLNVEQFWALYLGRSNCVMTEECISRGGTAATVVDPKLIFKSAVDKLASGIILVHNHPSGNLRPSQQDDNLTRRIKEGAALLDITLLDHIIITCKGYFSYAEHGRL